MPSEQDFYHELSYYTLAHSDPRFIHQHVVDAYSAQYADQHTKPISIVFALIGLYLYVEKNFTGRQVQRAHMRLAKKRTPWPSIKQPEWRGTIRVTDVVAVPPGQARDEMIQKWCVSVWKAWHESRDLIIDLVHSELGIQ